MAVVQWKRKASKRGGSLNVTIPPVLVESMGIDNGDTLIIESEGRFIRIYKESDYGSVEQLVDLLPRVDEFWIIHNNSNAKFEKALQISQAIQKFRREYEPVDPSLWFEMHKLVGWIHTPTAEVFSEFKLHLRAYLARLNDELNACFNLIEEA